MDGKIIIEAEYDDVNFQFLQEIFAMHKAQTIRATNGFEAIAKVKQNPDGLLVLMGIQMPEMDGWEATARIRAFNKTILIIAQTAFGFETDKQKSLLAGCTDYISKPINNEKLMGAINCALHKK